MTADLQPFLQEINTEKRATINTYINTEGPQYRSLARYLDEFTAAVVQALTPCW